MSDRSALQILQEWRERLASVSGEAYGRELAAAGRDHELRAAVSEILPELAGFWQKRIDRRRMLQLLGSSLAFAGVAACSRPDNESLAPYAAMPEGMVAGSPQTWATALCRGGYAHGVLVKTHMGRPIKIDGNPLHPASLGGSDVYSQAAALELFDPDRSRACTRRGEIVAWSSVLTRFAAARARWQRRGGQGLAILTGHLSSPTARRQLEELLRALPESRWYQHEPIDRDAVLDGARLAFKRAAEPIFDFTRAQVVVALDADFLGTMPGHLRYARDYTQRRRAPASSADRTRLYAVDSTPTLVGAAADHHLLAKASEVAHLAARLAEKLGVLQATNWDGSEQHEAWVSAAAKDLRDHAGRALVIAGDHQPAAVHAAAHAINHVLGNIGATVRLIEPVTSAAERRRGDIEDLSTAIADGAIESLLVLDANPVYCAPTAPPFASLIAHVPFTLHSGLYADETAAACEWHVPAPHAFESWSDARAFDGTASIVQPVISPLYDTHGIHQWLDLVQMGHSRAHRDQVRETWREHPDAHPAAFDELWHESLANGIIAGTQAPALELTLQQDWHTHVPLRGTRHDGIELRFVPDHSVWDGRYANSAWLQELPRPLTSLTWSNALLLSEGLARRLDVRNGDHLTVTHAGRQLVAPVWVTALQPELGIALALGYGRERAGSVGSHLGVSAYRLRTRAAQWIVAAVDLQRAPGFTALAAVQHHHLMHGRNLARQMTVSQLQQDHASLAHEPSRAPRSIYPDPQRHGRYAWGMTIDLDACIGCGACTIACQSENNIPAVGPEQVRLGREMHWIRVDSHRLPRDDHATIFQPVPCMHCELAPCEYVCPVEASIHDSEGLNLQIYNRCIGTRDCSQNCPYKVRRFNWLDFNGYEGHEPLAAPAAVMNPDVTVRSRGVMEKCTYCVQRISRARIDAKVQDREIGVDEVVPACVAACPAHAISFGDLRNAASEVNGWRQSPRHYVLLEELGTRPRTTYLAAVRNPNPDFGEEQQDADASGEPQ